MTQRTRGNVVPEDAAYFEPFEKAHPRTYPCPECEDLIVLQSETLQLTEDPVVLSCSRAVGKLLWPFSCSFCCIAQDCREVFECHGLMTVDYLVPSNLLEYFKRVVGGEEPAPDLLPSSDSGLIEVPIRHRFYPESFAWGGGSRLSMQRRADDARSTILRDRHWRCLEALHKLQAHSEEARKPAPKVARTIPAGLEPESIKASMKDLVDWGFLRSATGKTGGSWLTNAGRRALRLRRSW